MSVAASTEPNAMDALRGLVGKARQQGEPDVFYGKRGWTRYQIGMRLEIRAQGSEQCTEVTTHNVSGGGFGFWARQKTQVGTRIQVRQRNGLSGEWIDAIVAHCSLGIRGYLVGASFEKPLPGDAESAKRLTRRGGPPAIVQRVGRSRPQVSLWRRCLLAIIAASGTGVCSAAVAWYFFEHDPMVLPLVPALGLLVALVVGLVGSLSLAHFDARFFNALRTEFQCMAHGSASASVLPDAPSRELGELRKAFVELRAQWRQRQEDERARRQKLEELNLIKSNILNMVSHDMRTPLTSILLYAELLREDRETLSAEDQEHFLQIIADESTRLSRLVDDLLEAQRLEAGRVRWQFQTVDLTETLNNCARVFEVMTQSKSLQFTLNFPKSLPPIEADADKISQVVSNLLSNAVKYTPADGAIELSAEVHGPEVVICVSDTGPGIPRDQWDQIFDRFAQLSAAKYIRELPGVGLGLYIVRQIVERHGGRVWVDSEVGRGSAFFVSLPVHTPDAHRASAPRERTSAGRVLVCDADPELVTRVVQALQRADFDVRYAHSGCRLLNQLELGDFDVVFTDILLSDMDATDLLNAVVDTKGPACRLIVHSYAGDQQQLKKWGVDVFLQRPATVDEVVQAVRVAVQKRSGAARTVLLCGCGIAGNIEIRSALTKAGHLPITGKSLHEAAGLLRDYPIDVALIPADALDSEWSELQSLVDARDSNTRIAVVCGSIGKKESRLAEALGVTLTLRQDLEDDLVAVLDAVYEGRAMENLA